MTAPRHPESATGMVPQSGQRVVTRDGAELGRVKEIAADAFKVDAPMKRDYWLSVGSILSIGTAGIEMDFDESMLDAFKLDGPGEGVTSESPVLDAASETFSSTAEQDLRRDEQIHPDGAA